MKTDICKQCGKNKSSQRPALWYYDKSAEAPCFECQDEDIDKHIPLLNGDE